MQGPKNNFQGKPNIFFFARAQYYALNINGKTMSKYAKTIYQDFSNSYGQILNGFEGLESLL